MTVFESHVAMISNKGAVMRNVTLSRERVKSWIRYWRAAQMVNFTEIDSLEDMRSAQSFCSCMRIDLFAATGAEELWNALSEVRADDSAQAHEIECRSAAEALLKERNRKN